MDTRSRIETKCIEVLKQVSAQRDGDVCMKFIDFRTGNTYKVDEEGYFDFMKWYCANIDADVSANKWISIGEKVKNGRLLSFTFNISGKYCDNIHDISMVELIRKIQGVLVGLLDTSQSNDKFVCALMESGIYGEGKKAHTDIKFVFPNIRIDDKEYNSIIVPKVKRILEEYSRSDITIETLAKFFNTKLDKYIPLFYSSSSEKIAPYSLVKYYAKISRGKKDDDNIYDFDNKSNILLGDNSKKLINVPNDTLIALGLSEGYFPRDVIDTLVQPKKSTRKLNMKELVKSVKETVESTSSKSSRSRSSRRSFCDKASTSSINSECTATPQSSERRDILYTINDFTRDEIIEEDDKFSMAKLFLDMWKVDKFVKYDYWKTAGEALFDVTDGDLEGLAVWIAYTEDAIQRVNYIPKEFDTDIKRLCDEEWNTFHRETVTIESLAYIAREDNPTKFKEWHKSWCRPAMEMAVSSDHYDVGLAYYRTYFLDYMCYFGGKIVYMVFKNGRLKQSEGQEMRIAMSSDFAARFREMLADIAHDNTKPGGSKDKTELGDEICDQISYLISNLKKRPYKMNIMLEAADHFVNQKIPELLDANPDLLGTINGVFVANEYGIYLRKARPQDYVTKSIGTIYREDYDENTPAVKEVLEWSKKTFHDEDIEEYWWMIIASLLRGGNQYKKIFSLVGPKNNGKSAWEAALERLFGDYFDKLPASKLHNGFENSEGPSPLMACLRATRIVCIDEPDKKKPLRTGLAKQVTSDSYKARMLNQNPIKIFPLFTLFMITNDPPEWDEGRSESIDTRFTCIPFLTTFDENAPEDKEKQRKKRHYPMDENFSKKSQKYIAAILTIAVNKYKTLLEKGLRKIPENIQKYTDKYWERKDKFFKFTKDCIKENAKETDYVTFSSVYEAYKDWHAYFYPKRAVPDGAAFEEELYAKWKKPKNDKNRWYGKKIVEDGY